jgi:uncharacterized protein involved in exopolysaccharide biosynthesis
MEDLDNRYAEEGRALSPTLRDLLAVVFRHRRLVTLTFLGVVLGAILAAVLLPPQYEAHMQILVKHERMDPVITSEPNTVTQPNSQLVTEQDLNNEVELIKSQDLLVKVVKACSLDQERPSFWNFLRPNPAGEKNLRTAAAVRKLASDLKVEPIKNSSMIDVSYRTPDAALSSRVLTTLANDYLVKHLKVRRLPGAYDFFAQQADQYQNALVADEKQLVDFSQKQGRGAVSPQLQRNLVLQKASDFEASLWQARSSVAQTEERIRALEKQLAVTPTRVTTEDRESDNAQLLANLKSSLATLELKRTELLEKYEPSYRPVKEVEAQIAQARAGVAAQQNAQLQEKSTDRNPTYQWLEQELAKAKADLPTYQAQAEATQRIVNLYRNNAVSLEQEDIAHQDLVRDAKVAETNYLLYLKKAEEAHISNALDNKRIDNVAIAEAATVPAFPVHSRRLFLSLGILLAILVSLGSAFVADYFDSSFRTSDELAAFLNTPVLAAFPKKVA